MLLIITQYKQLNNFCLKIPYNLIKDIILSIIIRTNQLFIVDLDLESRYLCNGFVKKVYKNIL